MSNLQEEMDRITKIQEENEIRILSPHAALSSQSKGRLSPLPDERQDFRSPYTRDRDRIIHSASFRRMKDKAQVFILSKNDMVRTRLTHTLEVSQIARTVSRALQLNEDLTEAIAMGHDLGHTPFGHIGERALSKLCAEWFPDGQNIGEVDFLGQGLAWTKQTYTSFRHNVQSLRLVDFLEHKGKGLNLTYEVRDGILYHSKWGGSLNHPNPKYLPKTLEGQIVRIADRIAYINHDLQDVFRHKILKETDIPAAYYEVLGHTHSQRVGRAVMSMIQYFEKNGKIGIEDNINDHIDGLYKILSDKIYRSPMMERESAKVDFLIRELAEFYRASPDILGKEVGDIQYPENTTVEQKIIDHIAGMTDHFILKEFQRLRLPAGWAGL